MTKRYEIKEPVAAPGWAQECLTIYIRELHDDQLYMKHGPFLTMDQADRYQEWLEQDDAKPSRNLKV